MKPVSTKEFFKFIFGSLGGYLCLVSMDKSEKKSTPVKQHFYLYPEELDRAVGFAEKNCDRKDIYFSPFLFTEEKRIKESVSETPVVWADGDTCPIEELILKPSAVVRTSPDKYHFYWKLNPVETPDVGEYLSKKVAYYHADKGMDRSGWDLTQLLRVPGTLNHKGLPPHEVSKALVFYDTHYVESDFDVYPEVESNDSFTELGTIDLPDEKPEEIFDKYRKTLNVRALDLYNDTPDENWSHALWELECTLFEGGLSKEEVFVVARNAACNKYARDNRPESSLWKEVQRAEMNVVKRTEQPPVVDGPVFKMKAPKLLTDDQKEAVKTDRTFIEEYTDWAKTLGDAAVQYHPAGAFVILSTIMSGNIKLPTSFGTVIPNLWFMILADTTLTRKSTAMDNATDMLLDVDDDLLLATDGSIEGLMTALGTRSGKPSLFLRDEITGLIESMSKKEYMAGMMETLTKLYDGKQMKRILRRETIDVRDPRLIMFSGGIRNKMVELLDYKHVGSGFLPRFIFITAESDITRLKPVGPPTTATTEGRDELITKVRELYEFYAIPTTKMTTSLTSSSSTVSLPKQWHAELTDEAWQLYNSYEMRMLDFAIKSHDPSLLTPMMDRLAKSGLKASVLIAASRGCVDNIVVSEKDLLHAFFYIDQWMKHTIYIIQNIGTSGDEQRVQKVYQAVANEPGILRSQLMQRMYLSKRDADNIFGTLEQRAAIRRERKGAQGERLFPIG